MGSYRSTNQVGPQDPAQRDRRRKAKRDARTPQLEPGSCLCGRARELHAQEIDRDGRAYRGAATTPGPICKRYETA